MFRDGEHQRGPTSEESANAAAAAGIHEIFNKTQQTVLLEEGGKVYGVKFDVNFTNKTPFMDDYQPPPPPSGPSADASA